MNPREPHYPDPNHRDLLADRLLSTTSGGVHARLTRRAGSPTQDAAGALDRDMVARIRAGLGIPDGGRIADALGVGL